MFFSHNKTVSAGLSAAETISRVKFLNNKVQSEPLGNRMMSHRPTWYMRAENIYRFDESFPLSNT
jgi:hypothetical protein